MLKTGNGPRARTRRKTASRVSKASKGSKGVSRASKLNRAANRASKDSRASKVNRGSEGRGPYAAATPREEASRRAWIG